MAVRFTPGKNIALKVPTHEFERTVRFYRDVLGFAVAADNGSQCPSVVFEFGDKHLWVDPVATLSQAEIWLEVVTDDLAAAAQALNAAGCVRRDEIEPLPGDLRAFWISNPANLIHLVCADDE